MSIDPTPALPAHISLEQQKKLARELMAAHRASQPEAAARLRQRLTEFADENDEAIFAAPLPLQLSQLVLAREHGFASWTAFKKAIEVQAGRENTTTALREAIDRDDAAAMLPLLRTDAALLERAVYDGGETGYFAGYRPLPLIYALQCGRVEAVRAMISAFPTLLQTPDSQGRHPIDLISQPYGSWFPQSAARRRAVYDLLKTLGPAPGIEAAVCAGDHEYALALLERDPTLIDYTHRKWDWSLLVIAANAGCAPVVSKLLSMRPPGEAQLAEAVSRAAYGGLLETLALLLPLASNTVMNAALWGCGESLSLETARLLIQHGADPDAEVQGYGVYGDRKWTALASTLTTYSRKPWRGEFVDLLVVNGARRAIPLVNTASLDVNGPVLAFFRGRSDLLEGCLAHDPAMLRKGYSFSTVEWAVRTPLDGVTLLHLAMEYIDLEMAAWLVAHGADVNARAASDTPAGDGHTPLFHAVAAHTELYQAAGGSETAEQLVAWLLARGADPNLRATICNTTGLAGAMQNVPIRDVTPLGYLRAIATREDKRRLNRNPIAIALRAAGGGE